MSKKVKGVFAPITTPFVNEEISFERLRENIRKYRETPLNGLFVLGSNGESKSLTEDEKLQVLEAVLEEKGDRLMIMAGAGYESTRQTIAFSKKVQEMGADLVSLVTPGYLKKGLTDEAMAGHYKRVADALQIPVFAYNAPGFTGMTLSVKVIESISQHPNIGGMKDSSPAGIAKYLEFCGENFDVLAGTVNTLFIGLTLGAAGGVVSLGDAFPEPSCALYQKFVDGDIQGALALHHTLFRLNQSVSGAGGVAAVKYAMDLAGYHGGPPRLPLLPVSEAQKELVRAAVAKAGLSG